MVRSHDRFIVLVQFLVKLVLVRKVSRSGGMFRCALAWKGGNLVLVQVISAMTSTST